MEHRCRCRCLALLALLPVRPSPHLSGAAAVKVTAKKQFSTPVKPPQTRPDQRRTDDAPPGTDAIGDDLPSHHHHQPRHHDFFNIQSIDNGLWSIFGSWGPDLSRAQCVSAGGRNVELWCGRRIFVAKDRAKRMICTVYPHCPATPVCQRPARRSLAHTRNARSQSQVASRNPPHPGHAWLMMTPSSVSLQSISLVPRWLGHILTQVLELSIVATCLAQACFRLPRQLW